jgi:endonuclease G
MKILKRVFSMNSPLHKCLLLSLHVIVYSMLLSSCSTPTYHAVATTHRQKYFTSEPSLPQTVYPVKREGYQLAYDGRTRNAYWVYEYLTAESLKGETDRDHFQFKADRELPKALQTSNSDYEGSGFDKGHLCPAADQRANHEAMADTFYLSNISPQTPQFNRGYWQKLEKSVRELTSKYEALRVFTLPLFLPHEKQGRRYVTYEVIGKNNIAVPTHFCKVIFAEKSNGKTEVFAYVLPNKSIPSDTPLSKFSTTLEKVEQLSGVMFPAHSR